MGCVTRVPAPSTKSVNRKGDRIKRNVWRSKDQYVAMLFPPAIGLRQTHRDHLSVCALPIRRFRRGVADSRVASTGIALVDQLVDAVKPVAIAAVPELIVRDQPKLGVDPRPA